jgi:excisionase family DNA binding protein
MEAINSTAIPSLVVLPQSEWKDIKDLLNEVKDTLETKSADEVNGQWIDSTEARKLLGVSPKTWQTYRDKRVIPYVQFGRKIMVKRADIDAFMDSHYISRKEVDIK